MAAYKWVGRTFAVSADIVGKELEQLEMENGHIDPVDLVDAARPEDSVLHKLFEWDDTKAAELYRRNQAGNIIRSISVSIEESRVPEKAFINIVPTDIGQKKTGIYVNLRDSMDSPEYREIILNNAKNEMRIFRSKYSHLAKLAKVIAAIDEALE